MRRSRLRSHHHVSLKPRVCGWLAVLLLLPSLPINVHADALGRHEQVGRDTYLGGSYIELGISGSGTLGTSTSSPAGFHPGTLRKSIGLNTDSDGYDTGKDMTSGDYVLPGSPSEGFTVGYRSGPKTSTKTFTTEEQNGSNEVPGTTEDISTEEQLAAKTSGTTLDKAIGVEQTISFKPGDPFYKTTIHLTNTSVTASVYDVHYMRFLDPDMDADLNGDNSTINWVPSNPPQDPDAIVAAIGNKSDNVFMYVASDPRAQASVGFSRDPYSEPAFRSGGGTHIAAQASDDWLTLAFDAGNLKPGETTELVFYSSVDPDMNGALAAIHADYTTAMNDAPTDVTLAGDTLTWDAQPGTAVGQFSAVTEDTYAPMIYTLVNGENDKDNRYFAIRNNRLETAAPLTPGVNSYSIRVRATGPKGGMLEKVFTVHAQAPDRKTELTSLSLENGSLAPSFQRDVTSYEVNMNAGADHVTVFASVYDPDTTLSVNGVSVTDQVYGTQLLKYSEPLSSNLSTLEFRVTAPNGKYKTYTLQVNVAAEAPAAKPEELPAAETPTSSEPSGPAIVPAPVSSAPESEFPAPVTTAPIGATPVLPVPASTPTSDTYIAPGPPVTITFPFVPVVPADPGAPTPVFADGGSGGGASRLDDVIPSASSVEKAPATDTKRSNSTKSDSTVKKTVSTSGYVQGYQDGTFRPDQQVTRAELSVMLERLLNGSESEGAASTSFKDVPSTYWASGGIQLIQSYGWMKGYPDGSFQPGKAMTRAELASLIARWKELDTTVDNTASAQASDLNDTWAAAYIQQVLNAGWMQGYPDGKFYPDKPVTRAEVVTVLNHLQDIPADTATTATSWKDVSTKHWAYDAINKASH
ncbi:S-layer homology domain-containing protein [Paenibacillus dauci]|uniref:S-layer homology domain-containing protein n=1 Tax=Paenibacillus dauci TaxID=1567106 RepID=UPI000698D107|nr:S-layer homology domain-containing protein [Paenibacillus dauci]